MKKLTLKHAESVSAAKMMLQYKMSADQPARYRAILEAHNERLTQVYWWVVHAVVNPGLPVDHVPESTDELKAEKPKDNGTAAEQE